MANIREIEDAYGQGRRVLAWDCDRCGNQVERYPGERDVSCPGCHASYNASGQRLRDNWQDNMSNYDEDISDMDGYENQYSGDE